MNNRAPFKLILWWPGKRNGKGYQVTEIYYSFAAAAARAAYWQMKNGDAVATVVEVRA